MFRMPKEKEIDLVQLQKFIDKHKNNVKTRYEKLRDAYESNHEILKEPSKPAYKPDNRIVVNFPKYITDTMNGFFIGNPIKTVHSDENVAEFVEYLEKYNNQDDNNAELSKICSIYGSGFEMYYTDEASELCITYLTPTEAFMIYDDSIIERPKYFVRLYADEEGNEFGSISDARVVKRFEVTGGLHWVDEETPHYFDGVPATEYVENEERQGIFEPVMSMVNAYNKALSEKANDVDYFADAYLKILGTLVENEDIRFIRDNRIINFDGEDSDHITVEFMDKPNNDVAQENLLNRLEGWIFAISMVANISDENFGTACPICADAARKDSGYGRGIYKLKEMLPGTNAAPMHPFCRCAISPYEDSEEYESWIDFIDAGGTTSQWNTMNKKSTSMSATEKVIKWPKRKKSISKEGYRDLASYAREHGIILEGFKRFDGDINIIKQVIDDANEIAKKFSEIKNGRKKLTISLDEFMNANDFAITNGHIIRINADAFRNVQILQAEYEKLEKERWFVKGTDYRSIIKHEIGHVVANIYKIDGLEIAKKITGINSTTEMMMYLENTLSLYASEYEDGSEIISEVFADIFGTDNPSEFSLRFMDECDMIKKKGCDSMMTANKEPMYWRTSKEWYRVNKEKDCFELTDKAPERARKSFEQYKELQKK